MRSKLCLITFKSGKMARKCVCVATLVELSVDLYQMSDSYRLQFMLLLIFNLEVLANSFVTTERNTSEILLQLRSDYYVIANILTTSEKVNEAKLMEIRWFKTDLNGNKKDLYYYNSKVDYTNIFDKDDELGFQNVSTFCTGSLAPMRVA